MQAGIPKQYIELCGKPVLRHTLDKLAQLLVVDKFIVAVSASDEYFQESYLPDARFVRCDGGKERADSVLNALQVLQDFSPEWVLVHDAARPLVALTDIEKLIRECIENGEGGILASQVKDTIKRGDTYAEETVPRSALWQAYTPQMFRYQELKSALQTALQNGVTITDEASAMELQGHPVRLVAARSDNIKITTPEDLPLAEFIIQQQEKSHV